MGWYRGTAILSAAALGACTTVQQIDPSALAALPSHASGEPLVLQDHMGARVRLDPRSDVRLRTRDGERTAWFKAAELRVLDGGVIAYRGRGVQLEDVESVEIENIDGVKSFFLTVGIVGVAAAVIAFVVMAAEDDDASDGADLAIAEDGGDGRGRPAVDDASARGRPATPTSGGDAVGETSPRGRPAGPSAGPNVPRGRPAGDGDAPRGRPVAGTPARAPSPDASRGRPVGAVASSVRHASSEPIADPSSAAGPTFFDASAFWFELATLDPAAVGYSGGGVSTPPSSQGLFTAAASRRSTFAGLLQVQIGHGLESRRELSWSVGAGFSAYNMFELSGGLRAQDQNGIDRRYLGYGRVGGNFPFDAADFVGAPIALDLAFDDDGLAQMRVVWGIRFRMGQQLELAVLPVNPELNRVGETTFWTFPTSVQLGLRF